MFSFRSQYVTQTVEVESPATLKQLGKARQRNELLSEKLSSQNERCKQLEDHIRKSDEYSCNLQHKVIHAHLDRLNKSIIRPVSLLVKHQQRDGHKSLRGFDINAP